MTTADPLAILAASDAGERADAIAARYSLSLSCVYGILRTHRPGRLRSPRRRADSALRNTILALARVSEPKRVVQLMQGRCSKAYVYRLIKAQ